MSNGNKESTNPQGKNKQTGNNGHRRIRRSRVVILLALVALVLVVIALFFRMFGKVDLSTSDIGDSASNTTATSSTASQSTTSNIAGEATTKAPTTKSPTTKAPTIKAPGTTSAVISTSGHYVQPAGATWNLKLVNAWNTLDTNYSQPLVAYAGDSSRMVDSRAIDKLKALIKAGSAHNIRVASAYRSVAKQTELYERQVKSVMAGGKSRAEAEKLAANLVARPGTSEHNLGLAVDFLFENYSSMSESYEKTAAYSWMMQHCADYGFILRFPKNKQSITNVTFEPWHYRYVGEEAAKSIMSRSITLEEYLQEQGK